MTVGIDVPADEPLPESRFTAPTELCPHPEWWSSTDGDSTESEVAELVMGFVRGLQPRAVLETGTGFGEVAEAISDGLAQNQHGHLYTLENTGNRAQYARERLARSFGADRVTVIHTDSLAWTPPADVVFDFCWFDSFYPNRVPEFVRYRPFMRKGTIVCFHDTAPGHAAGFAPGSDIRSTITDALRRELRLVHLPTPRGMTIGEVIR